MKNLKLYTDSSGWVGCFENKEEALTYFMECDLRMNYLYPNLKRIDFAKTIDDIKEVETPFKANKLIFHNESFSEYCSELLDSYLENMSDDKRYTRPVNKDDCADESADFMYTNRGQSMIERAISRLTRVGEKYYDHLEIEISSNLYIEY